MIRGLALRSLTGLRLTSILEYVLQPLKAALSDSSGYVRQAGVIGLLKVYSISPESIVENDFVDTLYNMLRDRDPQVVVNCITALNEILASEGGIAINQAIVVYLLNRIREFSDWGQCCVMDLVARYVPANEDEMFGIMNLLDGCLKVANSAVVLAATKCFLAFTAKLPDIQRQVYLRLKTPILTLMASSSNEVAYAVLSHAALIIDRAPGSFDEAGNYTPGALLSPAYSSNAETSSPAQSDCAAILRFPSSCMSALPIPSHSACRHPGGRVQAVLLQVQRARRRQGAEDDVPAKAGQPRQRTRGALSDTLKTRYNCIARLILRYSPAPTSYCLTISSRSYLVAGGG